jgi:hypothetical protein
MVPIMTPSRKIWLAVLYTVNASVAFLWLFSYGRRYSFQLAGVQVTPGILAIAVMLLVDILLFVLFTRKLK